MSDGTSVGKIQLDIEVTKSSIASEIEGLSKAFNSGLKGSFGSIGSQMSGFVKNTISKIVGGLKEFGEVGNSSSKVASVGMDELKAKLKETELQIESTKDAIERLTSASEKGFTGFNYSAAIGRQKGILSELEQTASNTRLEIDRLTSSSNNSSKGFKKAEEGAKKAGRGFKIFGDQASKSSGKVNNFATMITSAFTRILKRIFIFNLIYKAIRGLINYMNGALKTNKQFTSSLNTIRTNLKVAFQPIYEFILPALNALMKAVATVTTYIASAISALFGKSYKQSFGATKGIEDAKKAMDGYGGAAKKAGKDAKGALMGFDELNQLDIADDDSSGGASGYQMEMPDLATIDMDGVSKFKEIMGSIFEPFRKAWDSEGLNVINSAKYAFEGIKGLIGAIASSWREVWTNGTGVEIVTRILAILQQAFEIVGRIANSFRIAWETNNMGTKILQNLADFLNIILDIFEDIGKSINKVWGEVGQKTVDIFMKALETTSEIIKKFGEALKVAWDTGGNYLFESLMRLAAKAVEVAGVIWNDFIGPVAKWLLDILGPAFGRALNFVAGFVDAAIWWLDVLMDGLSIIKTFAEKIVGFFAWLYDVLVGHSIIPDLVNSITEWFSNLGKWVSEKVKALVDAVIKFFTDLWDGVKKKTVDTWNSITTFISSTTSTISTNINKFAKSFKDTWDNIWNGAKTVFSNVWDSLTGIVKGVINGIIGIVNRFIDYWNKIELSVPKINIPFVGEVGGFSIGVPKIPNIPMLAKGGIIDQPTLAMVGERGKEAVIPFEDSGFLEALTGSIVNALLQILPFFVGGQGSQNSSEDKNIVVNLDGMPLVRILLPLINDELTRLGYRTIYQLG